MMTQDTLVSIALLRLGFEMHVLHANALPRAFTERQQPFVQFHALLAEPPFRKELLRRGEDGWVLMDCHGGNPDDCLTTIRLV